MDKIKSHRKCLTVILTPILLSPLIPLYQQIGLTSRVCIVIAMFTRKYISSVFCCKHFLSSLEDKIFGDAYINSSDG